MSLTQKQRTRRKNRGKLKNQKQMQKSGLVIQFTPNTKRYSAVSPKGFRHNQTKAV